MSKYIKLEDIKYRDVLYTFATNEELLVATEEDIESLPTIEVSEDCISREVAIDIIKNYDFEFPEYMKRFVNELRDAMKKDLVEDITNAPSVVPSRAEPMKGCDTK